MDKINITSAQYIVDSVTNDVKAITIIVDGLQMQAPLDPANRHYAEIMRQIEAGELTIQAAE